MAQKLAVDDAKVFKVKVRDTVSAMCEIMVATGRNRRSDFDYLHRKGEKGEIVAVLDEKRFHLVGMPGISPLSVDCLEVVGPASGKTVVADSEKGFVFG